MPRANGRDRPETSKGSSRFSWKWVGIGMYPAGSMNACPISSRPKSERSALIQSVARRDDRNFNRRFRVLRFVEFAHYITYYIV